MKDWRTFSSETGATALEDLDPDQIEARKSMLDTDPPEHSSLRAIVNKGFTPRAVAAYEDLLRELTRQILDEALPKGEFDFVEEIAKQLPIQVLCRILGVPAGGRRAADRVGRPMIGNTDPDLGGAAPGQRRRARSTASPVPQPGGDGARPTTATGSRPSGASDPRDDLVSKLVTREDEDGRRLTEREFDTLFLLLVVAGNETTRHRSRTACRR